MLPLFFPSSASADYPNRSCYFGEPGDSEDTVPFEFSNAYVLNMDMTMTCRTREGDWRKNMVRAPIIWVSPQNRIQEGDLLDGRKVSDYCSLATYRTGDPEDFSIDDNRYMLVQYRCGDQYNNIYIDGENDDGNLKDVRVWVENGTFTRKIRSSTYNLG